MYTFKRSRVLGGSAAFAALLGLVLTSMTPIGPAAGSEPLPELTRNADEEVSVVEVTLADHTELDKLVDTGVDLDHAAHLNPDGTITAHAVISNGEADALRARGFTVGATLHDEDDTEAVLAERDATIAAAIAGERGRSPPPRTRPRSPTSRSSAPTTTPRSAWATSRSRPSGPTARPTPPS